jgi:hypothetical protein
MGNKRTIPSRIGDGGYHLITDGVMTGTAVITSAAFNIQNLDNVGLQIDWTGSAVGVIQVLASVDGVTYHAFTFSPALAQPAGTAGGYMISLNQVPFPYVKVQYTNASSTGVLNVWLSAKDLN